MKRLKIIAEDLTFSNIVTMLVEILFTGGLSIRRSSVFFNKQRRYHEYQRKGFCGI